MGPTLGSQVDGSGSPTYTTNPEHYLLESLHVDTDLANAWVDEYGEAPPLASEFAQVWHILHI